MFDKVKNIVDISFVLKIYGAAMQKFRSVKSIIAYEVIFVVPGYIRSLSTFLYAVGDDQRSEQ